MEGIYEKGRTGDHILTHFSVICATLEIQREETRLMGATNMIDQYFP